MNNKFIISAIAVVTFFTITLAYNKEKCDAPPSVTGMCRAYFPSWTFREKKCQYFIYGGCGATANIFISSKECEAACLN